ncbi:MAG: class II aldolase/adducin family protein [Acidimicrobiales bacterium]
MTLPVDIIATAQAMNATGINSGTAGNVSARTSTGMLITPSGMNYDQLAPDDIVAMDFDATWFAIRGLKPSSEWRFHLDILRTRSDVNAIVHTHSTYATALAVHGRGIGAFHYMVAAAGGHDIRCAPYATFGTQELSGHVLQALEGRKACLMAHHGVVATGPDLPSALALAIQVEELARQYVAALALGEPPTLSAAEVSEVRSRMDAAGYGVASGEEIDLTAGEVDADILPLER